MAKLPNYYTIKYKSISSITLYEIETTDPYKHFHQIDSTEYIVHCLTLQALKMLRTPELKPYIIYVRAPQFERLKETRHRAYARSTFDETSSRSFTVRKKGWVKV